MNYFKQYRNIENLESDIAYEAYEKLIFTVFPKVIDFAQNNPVKRVRIRLGFTNHKDGLTGELVDIMFGDEVVAKGINLKEFTAYLENIPSIEITSFLNKQELLLDVDTLKLINFYYEERQRDEHLKQESKKDLNSFEKCQLESDITYEAYAKLTFSTVPEIIKIALDNQIKRLKIHLEFKNHQTGFTGVVGDVMLGDVRIAKGVNIIEFKEYIENIPNADVITFKRLKHLDVYIDTLDLINFYYEELQREEYEVGSKINTGNKLEEKQNEPIEYSDTISRITDFAIDNCLASTLTIHLDFINKPTKEHNLNDVMAVISVGDMVMGEVNVGYFIATINDIPSIHILTYDNDELIFTVDIADLLDYEHEKLLESEQARLQLR